MKPSTETVLLLIRPPMPDPEESTTARGPLMMESVLSAIHALRGADSDVSLEIGFAHGKVGLYARVSRRTAALLQSQFYGQYPDAEIEEVPLETFAVSEGEKVVSADLCLAAPEVFPIKRYSQFADVSSRQNVDTIAGITSALVQYPQEGMRGHVQVLLRPVSGSYRRRALKLIPFLSKGLSKYSNRYAKLLTRASLSRGFTWLLYLPFHMFFGGFRVWLAPISQIATPPQEGEPVFSEEGIELTSQINTRGHDREDSTTAAVDKVNRLLFRSSVHINVITPKQHCVDAEVKVQEIASSFQQFTLPHCNGFILLRSRVLPQLPSSMKSSYVLSSEEVATIWHIPTALVQTPNFDRVSSKKLEPPINLPLITKQNDTELTTLGEAVYRGKRIRFGIQREDRRRHVYMIGKTGMGKSVFLENMIFSDIFAGRGVGVIDPHGDLIDSILQLIPKRRMNDVILFDPSDRNFPLSFNVLECHIPEQRSLIVSGLMSVFTKIWPDVWSGRMEHILRNTLLALVEAGDASMLGIPRMFSDAAYRAKIVAKVTDPTVKSFWEAEFASWTEKYQVEATAAIQNKIGQLLSSPLMRNIIGQVRSRLDLRHAMDTGKIVLVNLSKGKIGEDTAAFLGSMLVTKFQIDAMSRADIPEKDRRDFFLFVDEFQNFATESFATILSEARKYRLSLTMANQYVTQLLLGDRNTTLRDAVFGNVGTLLSFQVGSDDAEVMSLQFEEMVTPKDILSLPKYHVYMRLLIDGFPSKPFSVSTLPPPNFQKSEDRTEKIRLLSRERYSEKREIVEEKISQWLSSAVVAAKNTKYQAKQAEKEEEEKKKARAKKMSLEDYRKWRDQEMWKNEFNALRKKEFLGEALTDDERQQMKDLEEKLKKTCGVPPPSKSMLQAKEDREKGKGAA
ncbi:hypothetical protein COU77_02910 [Candidatus Peregrinibacteria bacterium CG10_big_fil_rev_8_21_14_0_10_49_16]|nr:MAG: hypothetical protein COW95_02425 [Candidatus Peregrinibacteria bacterium CG22_combo_CG10-13_8_21_14_all_49_11]PIR51986.1 MAG: hypothetical protein COU77_02910 [Candidatus Peregrinibacteria bacterium CG10_big_fil_rev_8_21_14_0_10_49_16]